MAICSPKSINSTLKEKVTIGFMNRYHFIPNDKNFLHPNLQNFDASRSAGMSTMNHKQPQNQGCLDFLKCCEFKYGHKMDFSSNLWPLNASKIFLSKFFPVLFSTINIKSVLLYIGIFWPSKGFQILIYYEATTKCQSFFD